MAKGSSPNRKKMITEESLELELEVTSEWVGMNYTNIQQVWERTLPLDEKCNLSL